MKRLHRLRRQAPLAFITALLLALAGCSVLPRPEALDVYRLPAASWPRDGGPRLPLSLRIDRPSAGAALGGVRIVVIPEDDRLNVYKGASWTDPAPVLVRERLLEAFRANGRIGALSSDEFRLQADYEIASDLLAFHSEYRAGEAQVVVGLAARLVRNPGRRIIASREFAVRERAAGREVGEVVDGFGRASAELAVEVLRWALGELQACADGGCEPE